MGPMVWCIGLIHSHAISWPAVTSKTRPLVPSQMSVLPFGRRCAPEMCPLKNCWRGLASYCQATALSFGFTSMTRE